MKLEELKKLCEQATPGPWWHTHVFDGEEVIRYGEPPQTLTCVESFDDAAFIAAARDALPLLIAVARAAIVLAGDGVSDGEGMYMVEDRFREGVRAALAALESP